MILSKEKKEEELELEYLCPKEQKWERNLDLEYFVQIKGEEEKSKSSQKRSEEFRRLRRKENYDWVSFANRLQNNSMLPFRATNRKSACTKHVSNWS